MFWPRLSCFVYGGHQQKDVQYQSELPIRDLHPSDASEGKGLGTTYLGICNVARLRQ